MTATVADIRERHSLGHQPTSNPTYCAENDGMSASYCEVGFLLHTIDRMTDAKDTVARLLDEALEALATTGHVITKGGYCARCEGGCLVGFTNLAETPLVEPSPFVVAP